VPSPEQIAALRGSVAVSRLDHVSHVRIRGADSYERLDRLLPSSLHLRDGQLLHTLLLDERAHPLADVYLCWDDEEFFMLAEGLSPGELIDYLRQELPVADGFQIEDRTETDAIISLEGPYAWELLGNAVDPEGIGLPYLTFYHLDRWICYRAGKTGEYGYGLIVPRSEAADLEQRLHEEGGALDVAQADLDALDQCALENWFFNIRREGREPVTPIELQLQWRVSYHKEFTGSAALRARRGHVRQRLTFLLADAEVRVGDSVHIEDQVAGRVVNAGFSHVRGDWTSLALIDLAYAYPGIDSFTVGEASVPGRSVSPPVLNNRSLTISPQLHSYATRHEQRFPDSIRYWR
jgi:glycine cleavage system aminomethyltransferase T